MKYLIIINPVSGAGNQEEVVDNLRAIMAEKGLDHEFYLTRGEKDDEAIQKVLRQYKPDRIAACGGDGTLQLVARNLIGKKYIMGILPMGSANGLAKAMEIPKDTTAALELFLTGGRTIPLDLLKVNGHLCIHLSDIGTNALLVKSYEEAGDKGMLGYARHLIASIKESELMRYTITTPEETYEKEGYMLTIANANKYGTGVHISEGSVSDGKFEICNVQSIDLESAVKAGLTALNVFVDKNMFSDVISCRKASIQINREVHLQIDGEYMGETDKLDVQIMPGAVTVIVPE